MQVGQPACSSFPGVFTLSTVTDVFPSVPHGTAVHSVSLPCGRDCSAREAVPRAPAFSLGTGSELEASEGRGPGVQAELSPWALSQRSRLMLCWTSTWGYPEVSRGAPPLAR